MRVLDRMMRSLGFERATSAIAIDPYATIAGIVPRTQNASWSSWDSAIAHKTTLQRLALAYRCLNLVAHGAGVAPVRVYDEAKDNESVPDHPLRALMRRPNPHMGEATFHGTVAMRAAYSGFCVVEKERNRLNEVIGLWPLPSSWLTPVLQSGKAPDWRVRIPGYSQTHILKSEDVIPFRWADTPNGDPRGLGCMEVALREVDVLNSMMEFLKKFFDSGAVPLYGLVPDTFTGQTLNQKTIDKILEQFLARHGGLDLAALPMVLSGIKDVKRLGFDMNELAYVDLRDLSELAIIQAFGIPASVAQVRVGLEHSDSRANVEGDEGKFYRQTIIPFWSRWDDALTINLLPDFDSDPTISLEFDTTKVTYLQEDRNAKAQWVGAAVSGGYMSVHAWHREMGLPEPKGDDYYLRPVMAVPVPIDDPLMIEGLPAPTQIAESTPELPVGEDPAQLSAGHVSRSFYDDPKMYMPLSAEDARSLYESTRARSRHERNAARAAAGDRKQMARLARMAGPRIDAWFQAQGKRIIPKIVATLGSAVVIEQLAEDPTAGVNWNSENARLNEVITRIYNAAGQTAFETAKSVHGLDPGTWNISNPRIKDIMTSIAGRVLGINETTRADIQRIVADGLANGDAQEKIAEALKGLYEETYTSRSLTIARTEVTNAYGKASIVAYKESGTADRAEMFDNPDHDEDYGASDGLTCADRDGMVVDLDDADDHLEAEHPNGSLTFAPVLKGED